MVDVTAITYLPETSAWSPVPRLEDGFWPTGGPVAPEKDSGLMNWQAQVLAARTKYLRDRVDLLSTRADGVVTVGPGGEYATINAALSVLSERRPAYKAGGFTSAIRLRAGFVMTEQVIIRGINLGWVRIVAEDGVVLIDRSRLTVSPGADDRYPAFCAHDGGVLPWIGAHFSMTSTGAEAGRDGIYLFNAGSAVIDVAAGVTSAGGNGLRVTTGGVVSANQSNFQDAKSTAASIKGGARAALEGANLSGSRIGLDAGNGAVVHAGLVNCSGAADYGILAQSGATVNAVGCFAQRNTTQTTTTDLVVLKGSTIAAVDGAGGTSVPPNTVTAAGIIFK